MKARAPSGPAMYPDRPELLFTMDKKCDRSIHMMKLLAFIRIKEPISIMLSNVINAF